MPKPSEFYFTVRGSWPFPYDMLRYDGAYPRTQNDAAKLQALARDTTDAGIVEIDMATRDPNAPNRRRWQSHLWAVL
jgi:hypothetical protein